MQWKAALLLILFNLCLGCTSEQWVKEYVKGETTGLQETLDSRTAEADRSLEELVKRQTAQEEQIKELNAALEAVNERLTKWQNFIVRLKEEREKAKGKPPVITKEEPAITKEETERPKEEPSTKKGEEEIIKLMGEEITHLRVEEEEIDKKFAKLGEIEKDLNRLKESQQLDYTTLNKELVSLDNRISDAKRFVDMNVSAMLKAQSLLKEFTIEEVRTLRVERQEYARELESIKGRLQAIEDATGKKGTSSNESVQQTP
ncbi:MAG TPA: hypothetical protein ACFYED_06330 [Candidatus Tripitaka californicus]|nr:hypothetical protein [Planctomycetota bacterium]